MATRVMIPASPDGLKPRAPPVELLLLDDDGFEVDPVDEGDPPPEDEEELAPVALAYRDAMSVMKDKLRENIKRHLEGIKRLVSGGVYSKDHTSFTVSKNRHQ